MLGIICRNGPEHWWHSGEEMPRPRMEIIEIQADGTELTLIRSLFTWSTSSGITIPFSTLPVQHWFGDMAKTIYQALLYQSKK